MAACCIGGTHAVYSLQQGLETLGTVLTRLLAAWEALIHAHQQQHGLEALGSPATSVQDILVYFFSSQSASGVTSTATVSLTSP